MSWMYDPYFSLYWSNPSFFPRPLLYDIYGVPDPFTYVEPPPSWPTNLVPEMNEDDIMKAVGWVGTRGELVGRLHWGEHMGVVRKHPYLYRYQLHPDMIKYLKDLSAPPEGSGGGEKKKTKDKGEKGEKKDE